MIPLNKPYIDKSKQRKDLNRFIKSYYPDRNYFLTISARQGLNEIYSKLNKENGPREVSVSPFVCAEAIYPIIENGHHINFIDINPRTLNMDESLLSNNLDIVQAIHLGGNPQDMNQIKKSNPSILIEDCAQCFGSYYNEIPLGMFGDFSVFSFMKNIYSIGGGLLLSKHSNIEEVLNHKEFDAISTYYRFIKRYLESKSQEKKNISSYILEFILKLKPENTNFKLNNASINKMIIKSIEKQINSFENIIIKRINNAKYLIDNLNSDNIYTQEISSLGKSNYLRVYIVLKNKKSKEVIDLLRRKGIGANHLTQSYLHPHQPRFDSNTYLKKFIRKESLPNYFELHDRVISIPVSPSLTRDNLDKQIDIINCI